ncbi:MAG: cob(I)yrinic acid a,c-diamide adenosyltransferase [Candidatus Aenigmarchaeota archaeon]|nr:cob(I)yrinic acid a,c-diamide adenosyltransferase [Candidatus Aenigmarchaeota archaeon]MDW8149032.1 cob(I)yrinic acid a,c-diamide adenosyltransferase [Candidatus Aenigmarchaeota archaeon]
MKSFHKGDNGKTFIRNCLADKDELIVECMGELDELNSFIGVIREELEFKDLDKILENIQNHIFEIGSCLHLKKNFNRENIGYLEKTADEFEKEIREIKKFIYPIGKIQYCRALCRRVERRFVALAKNNKEVDKNIIVYLNRLSDFLFIIGRVYNKRKKLEEKQWPP